MPSKSHGSENISLALPNLRTEFAKRYYIWAKADSQREVQQNFPFVRMVKSRSASRLLSVVGPMTQSERLQLLIAMVKRFHKIGMAAAGESVDAGEEQMVRNFLTQQPTLGRTSGQLGSKQLDRKALREAICMEINKSNGPVANCKKNEFHFERAIGRFRIKTLFDTGSRFRDVTYHHIVTEPKGNAIGIGISLLHWLGISETEWVLESNSEILGTAKALAEVSSHFLNGAEAFLADLG